MVSGRAQALDDVLVARRSCRAFLDTPVPDRTIDEIVAAAGRTASWCNTQPWHVTVLSDRALEGLRRDLVAAAEEAPGVAAFEAGTPTYLGESLRRRREAGWALYDAVGVARGDRAASSRQALENFRFFGAPHLAVVSADAHLGAYGLVDCGGFVALFLAAAEARGIATIAQAAVVSRPEIVRRHVSLPPDRTLVCGIAFGHRDDDHPSNSFRTTRVPLDEVRTYIRDPSGENR